MYLNIIQLAESLGVEERMVENWIRNEGLPCVRDCGRVLFERGQVAEWAAQRGLGARAGFLAPTGTTPVAGRELLNLLKAGGIHRNIAASSVLPLLAELLKALPGATPPVREMLAQRMHAPDGITWAPVGGGLALPHLRTHITLGRGAGLLAVLFLLEPLPLQVPPEDGEPVDRLLFFIAPSPRAHLELLSRLSAALTRHGLRELLREGAADPLLMAALAAAEPAAAVQPPQTPAEK